MFRAILYVALPIIIATIMGMALQALFPIVKSWLLELPGILQNRWNDMKLLYEEKYGDESEK